MTKRFWCRLFHRRIMWPGVKVYECRACLEQFPNLMKGDSLWYKRKRNQQYGQYAAMLTNQAQNMFGQSALANAAQCGGQDILGQAATNSFASLSGNGCAGNINRRGGNVLFPDLDLFN